MLSVMGISRSEFRNEIRRPSEEKMLFINFIPYVTDEGKFACCMVVPKGMELRRVKDDFSFG
jgi:hypothetical protein